MLMKAGSFTEHLVKGTDSMNNRPPISSSPSSSISSLRKRKPRNRLNLIYIIAGVLILGGILLLISWLFGPSKPLNTFFATETPTPTLTFTPTSTSTPTETPTATATATAIILRLLWRNTIWAMTASHGYCCLTHMVA
jgi:hypothetical protein